MSHLEQARRQRYLDWLYRQDGRESPSHPLHGLYTGLLLERRQALIKFDMKVAVGE